jgi:hypothetical protein
VRPQELVHDVELLALDRVLGFQPAPRLYLLLRVQRLVLVDLANARGDVGQDELVEIMGYLFAIPRMPSVPK